MRANERSAAASGVSVAQVKLIAFAIGGFLAGLGGAMLAYQQTSADYSSYTAVGSVTFFATVYIAGITSVSGGINAGVIAAGGIAYTLVNNGVPLWIYVLLVGLLLVGIVQLVRPTLLAPPWPSSGWDRSRRPSPTTAASSSAPTTRPSAASCSS